KPTTTDIGGTRRYRDKLRSKRGVPRASTWSLIAGRNTVAVYTKHLQLHEHEFAMHTFQSSWTSAFANEFDCVQCLTAINKPSFTSTRIPVRNSVGLQTRIAERSSIA